MRANLDHCSQASVTDKSCPAYLKVEYRASGIYHSYERTYTDIIEAYSEVGGLKELVFLASMFVYMFYNGFAMSSFLRNKLLNLDSIRGMLQQTKTRSVAGQSSITLEPQNPEIYSLQEGIAAPQSKKSSEAPLKLKSQIADLKEGLDEMVETSLDVSTLIRELNNWKILRQIIFRQYHLELLPLVAIEVKRKQQQAESHNRKESALINSIQPSTSESISLQDAFVHLVEKKRARFIQNQAGRVENTQHSEDVFSQIQRGIDDYFLLNLPEYLSQEGHMAVPADHLNDDAAKRNEEIRMGDYQPESALFGDIKEKNPILSKRNHHQLGGSQIGFSNK